MMRSLPITLFVLLILVKPVCTLRLRLTTRARYFGRLQR
jgi:hypothetical protein